MKFRDPLRRITIRWPRQIGGPRHGQPREPDPPADRIIAYAQLADRPLDAAEPDVYVEHSIKFAAGGRLVDVKVHAHSQLTTGDVAWMVLAEALDIPDPLR